MKKIVGKTKKTSSPKHKKNRPIKDFPLSSTWDYSKVRKDCTAPHLSLASGNGLFSLEIGVWH